MKGDNDYLIGTLNFILEVEKDPLQGGIQSTSEIHDLTQQIEDITEEVIGDNYYNKTETDSLLDDKLNVWQLKPYPTIGTGIEVAKVFTGGDSEHGAYSYVANTRIPAYTMTETNNLLSEKADASDVYTKAQIEAKLADKASITYVDGEISAVDAVLIDMQTDIDRKADASDVYTKAQVDSALALKANATDVYTKQEVDNIILDIMPVDIASGAIATFNTQLAAPLVSVIADITATGGNGTPDNPIPINGYSEANITRCGVNLWDGTKENYQASILTYGLSTYIYYDLPNGTYIISTNAPTGYIWAGKGNGTGFVDTSNYVRVYSGTPITITLTEREGLCVGILTSDMDTALSYDTQLEVGSTPTSYHAYNGNTYTIAFGQTVYGGVLDVTRGKLKPCIEYPSYNGETLSGRWLSSEATYVEGATPPTGSQVVSLDDYGTDIDITPEVISAIVGTNNVFADTGDIEVKFKTTIQDYIDSKIGG